MVITAQASQTELSRRARLHKVDVDKYERGHADAWPAFKQRTAAVLAGLLGADMDDVMGAIYPDEPEPPRPPRLVLIDDRKQD